MSNITPTTNHIRASIFTTGYAEIQKFVNGDPTLLASSPIAIDANKTYHCVLTCNGNYFALMVNGILAVSATDDNALKTNTHVGMFMATYTVGSADCFDNFVVKG